MDATNTHSATDTARENSILAGFVTKQELARALGRSPRTLDRWETRRIAPPRVVLGRTILYSVASVREWLQSREQRRGR